MRPKLVARARVSAIWTGVAVAVALLIGIAILSHPQQATAATFTVTKEADTDDGVCDAGLTGVCSP